MQQAVTARCQQHSVAFPGQKQLRNLNVHTHNSWLSTGTCGQPLCPVVESQNVLISKFAKVRIQLQNSRTKHALSISTGHEV